MAADRRLETSDVGEVTVVRFVDRRLVDMDQIQQVGQELNQLVETKGDPKLLLNFADVDFLSSAALGKLITLDKKLKQSGGQLVLCDIRPEIQEVFAITRLDRLFDIVDDEDEALAAFSGP